MEEEEEINSYINPRASIFSKISTAGSVLDKVDILQTIQDCYLIKEFEKENLLMQREIQIGRNKWKRTLELLQETVDAIMILQYTIDGCTEVEEALN
jgi:hypothetical protein